MKVTLVNNVMVHLFQIQVAIKCLSRERMQSNPIEFLKEAAIMHGIEHEHIVRLYGVVLDTNALMLVCFKAISLIDRLNNSDLAHEVWIN